MESIPPKSKRVTIQLNGSCFEKAGQRTIENDDVSNVGDKYNYVFCNIKILVMCHVCDTYDDETNGS